MTCARNSRLSHTGLEEVKTSYSRPFNINNRENNKILAIKRQELHKQQTVCLQKKNRKQSILVIQE